MKNNLLIIVAAILMIIAVAGASYTVWHLEKRVSYSFQYEEMVKKTIVEMVKPEALKQND
jgi:flagellar basal body-associated protein FliL